MINNIGCKVEGFVKIYNPETNEVFVDKKNAIHYENFSEALALSVANRGKGYIFEMEFGNGGTSVDPTGVITYLPPNVSAQNDGLYNRTYSKVVNDTAVTLNSNPLRNRIEVRHTPGETFTDILVTCLLDYGEPQETETQAAQSSFDNSENLDQDYVFDELGLRSFVPTNEGVSRLLTHVIFHPVQKSLNRLIQIDYTIRVSSLTNLSSSL